MVIRYQKGKNQNQCTMLYIIGVIFFMWIVFFFVEDNLKKVLTHTWCLEQGKKTWCHFFVKHLDVFATLLSGILLLIFSRMTTTTPELTEQYSLHHANNDFKSTFLVVALIIFIVVLSAKMGVTKLLAKLSADNNPKREFDKVGFVSFFSSGFLDNTACTQANLEACDLRKKSNTTANIPNAANAGGAASPIGDSTTIFIVLIKGFISPIAILWMYIPSLIGYLTSHFLIRRNVDKLTLHDVSHVSVNYKHSVVSLVALLLIPVLKIGLHMDAIYAASISALFITIYYLLTHRVFRLSEHELEEILKPSLLLGLMVWQVFSLGYSGFLYEVITPIFAGHGVLIAVIMAGVLSIFMDNMAVVALCVLVFGAGADPIYPAGHPFWMMLAVSAGMSGSAHMPASAAGLILKEKYQHVVNVPTYIKIVGWQAALGWLVAVFIAYFMYVVGII